MSAFREGIVMASIAVLYRKGWVIGFGTLLLVSVMVWIRLPHWRPHVLHDFAMQPPKPAADFTVVYLSYADNVSRLLPNPLSDGNQPVIRS